MGTAQVANTFIGSEVKPFSQDRSDGPSEPAVPPTPSLVWLPDVGQLGEHATCALCSHALLLVSVNLQKPQTATRFMRLDHTESWTAGQCFVFASLANSWSAWQSQLVNSCLSDSHLIAPPHKTVQRCDRKCLTVTS